MKVKSHNSKDDISVHFALLFFLLVLCLIVGLQFRNYLNMNSKSKIISCVEPLSFPFKVLTSIAKLYFVSDLICCRLRTHFSFVFTIKITFRLETLKWKHPRGEMVQTSTPMHLTGRERYAHIEQPKYKIY